MSFALFVAMSAGPASADMIIGEMETDFPICGLSDFTVRTMVSRYFAQRKAYLQGISETISVAVSAVVTDEAAHKEALAEANAVLTNSTITINSIIIGDYAACAAATEVATYLIDGEVTQETVVHTIRVYTKNDNALIVCSDGYIVSAIGFSSASYVSPEALELATVTLYESATCIVRVAMDERGTAPDSNGKTKYGIWYGDMVNNSYYDTTAWCAMFVTWCAYRANVPSSVILYTALVPNMSGHLDNAGRYHRSASGGGNYIPQPGDLIFIGVNDSDTFASPGHVGIVAYATANEVYYIEGNYNYWTEETGTKKQVWYSVRTLTCTEIIGYGHPNYGGATHVYQEWEYDNYMHWSSCAACDFYMVNTHDLYESSTGFACTVCDYIRPY